ncbi:MAG: SDR family NAD(P)-dependent oxidoreductase, partial [Thermodesulfobacteriota bacterium]
ERMPDLPSVSPDALASLKTLGEIVAHVTRVNQQPEEPLTASDHFSRLDVTYTFPAERETGEEPVVPQVLRRIVSPLERSAPAGRTPVIPGDHPVCILDDGNGLGRSIAATLHGRNIRTELIPREALHEIDAMETRYPSPAGLILIPDVDLISDRFSRPNTWNESDRQFLQLAFQLAKTFGPRLMKIGENGAAVFAVITRLDGCFGFRGQGVLHPLHGGLAGLAKTAAIEWPKVQCRAIDVDPAWKGHDDIAVRIADELFHEGPVEVGITPSARYELGLQTAPPPEGKIDLGPKDVVAITGGARGVTAACAYALAKHAKPAIALLGRSRPPSPEPEWLLSLNDEAAIKKAIIAHEFADGSATPLAVEKAFKRHMANREIARNLEKLKSTGARIRYYSVDVRDPSAVGEVLDHIRGELGPVSGLIHGAGVLEDRLIIDKTPAQFDKVFGTKAGGLKVMLEALSRDSIRYLVLFSSVAGRMGNKGQADYAMANEVLNKIAQQEAFHRKKCRVVSINWGPWDGGMVSPSLRREFKKQRIDLIPVNSGAMCMLYEMMGDRTAPVEVVIGAGLLPDERSAVGRETNAGAAGSAMEKPAPQQKTANGSGHFRQIVDLDTYPILEAHVLGGKPVVPFALMAEWIGHGALRRNPELFLHGIDDMRLLSGIKLNGFAREVVLLTGQPEKVDNFIKVPVELRNSDEGETGTIHARATAILADHPALPPAFSIPAGIGSSPFPKSTREVYEQVLFHGKRLHGIKEIGAYSEKGMIARLASAPLPQEWILSPFRDTWLSDPLVLDAAFQMAILWCHQTIGRVSLPSYSACYRQYSPRFPREDILAVLEVTRWTDHKMEGDFTFLDQDHQVVARLQGYEAVVDASLMKAFKPSTAEE